MLSLPLFKPLLTNKPLLLPPDEENKKSVLTSPPISILRRAFGLWQPEFRLPEFRLMRISRMIQPQSSQVRNRRTGSFHFANSSDSHQ